MTYFKNNLYKDTDNKNLKKNYESYILLYNKRVFILYLMAVNPIVFSRSI